MKYAIGDTVKDLSDGDIGVVTRIDYDEFGVGVVCAIWTGTGDEQWFDSDNTNFIKDMKMTIKWQIGDKVLDTNYKDTGIITRIVRDETGEAGFDEIWCEWTDLNGNVGYLKAWFESTDPSFVKIEPELEKPKKEKSRHVHANLIMKWANGAKIQRQTDTGWVLDSKPTWNENNVYRIVDNTTLFHWIVSNPHRGISKKISIDQYSFDSPAMEPFKERGWIFHYPIIE